MNTHHTHDAGKTDSLMERVLHRIDTEDLSPKAKWVFMVRNGGFWVLGVVSIVVGALAFSAALFEIENADWLLFPATHSNFLSFFLETAPFWWAFVLLLFVGLGYENIRHTKRGYRYPLSLIVAGAILTSVTIGTVLYAAGLGERVEEGFGDHPPFYRPIIMVERSGWEHPENGVLGGTVLSASSTLATFTLQDFSGVVWTVDDDDLGPPDLTAVARGGEVRVVGVPMTGSTTTFHACFVFPWQPHGTFISTSEPPPTAFFASTSEINAAPERSEECRDIRPYEALHDLPR